MTLRLHKVSKQIDRLQESAVARAEKLRTDLPKVRRALDLAAERDDLPQKAKTEAERGWNGAMPACGEAIAFRKSAPSAPAALALVAVDGSQVYPDRHSASLFYAINIGYFILHSDSGETAADSEPAVFFEDDSLFPDGNLISNTILNARRTVDEMSVLARLAVAERAAGHARPVFALADGGFALRIDEKTFPPAERESLQKRFFSAIDSLARDMIPVAGYIARPGGSPVLSLIDLALDPSPKANASRGKGGRSPFPGLDDRVLFETLLAPGERSAVFEFAAYWNDLYRNREPNQSAHFFYLNVGRRYPVIARVEIPHGTAQDPALVDRVHAALVEQSAVTLNDPYPYALIRADEEAFVSGEEKQFLEEQMAVSLIRGGLRLSRSEKLSHKGRARKH